LRYLGYAIRVLARTPWFTCGVVATLALGIGANSAMFSAIDAILLRPLPLPDGDRLVRVSEIREGVGATNIAPPRLADWSQMSSAFAALSGYATDDVVDTTGEFPERLRRAVVAPGFLDVLGLEPARGRGFETGEHSLGGPAAVMISDRLWRNRGADPDILGSTVRSGGQSFVLAGVLPAQVRILDSDVDVWAPFPMDAPFARSRDPAWLAGIGRLHPGVTLEQAQADLERVQALLAEQYSGIDRAIGVQVTPLKDTLVGSARQSLWFLFGAVTVLLMIACTNIAALLLARAAHREREAAIRYSLGASRSSIVLQLLTEMAVIAFAGAVLGTLVAEGAVHAIRGLAPSLPRADEIAVDGRTLLYTIVCGLAVTLACGVLPALRNARRPHAPAARALISPRHSLQWTLVGVQLALAVTLLAGAGLLVRSIDALSRVESGFDASRVLAFGVTGRFGEAGGSDGLVRRINGTLDELGALPGIEAAATASALPGVPGELQKVFELATGRAETEPQLIAENRVVSPSYFATMGIPLEAGELCRRPTGSADAREIVVNRAFADRYFSGRSVLGLELRGDSAGRIAGVVADARELGAHREPIPTVYGCLDATSAAPWFLVRTTGEPLAAARAIRAKLAELEPLRPVYDLAPLAERIAGGYAQHRLRTLLLALFAAMALSLACVGVYATLSYVVSLRAREVGLRMALGATARSVVARFLRQTLRVVAGACAAGLALSIAFTRTLEGMLFGVAPTDPITLAGVVAIVVAVAALAAAIPAARAARVEPLAALRDE
jgi:putative ABC transport system permease protein